MPKTPDGGYPLSFTLSPQEALATLSQYDSNVATLNRNIQQLKPHLKAASSASKNRSQLEQELNHLKIQLVTQGQCLQACQILVAASKQHPTLIISSILSDLIGLCTDHIHIDKFWPNPEEPIKEHLSNPDNLGLPSHGDRSHQILDMNAIKDSPKYITFLHKTRALQTIDLRSLTKEMRVPFFLNLYNCITLHAILELNGLPQSHADRKKFFATYAYNVGGYNWTLNDVEDGILRSNSKSRWFPGTQFATDGSDPRIQFILPEKDSRIHFCLSTMTNHSPPLRVFRVNGIQDQLTEAAKEYMKRLVTIDMGNRAVLLPSLIRWYDSDFCIDHDNLHTFPFASLMDPNTRIYSDLKFMLKGSTEIVLKQGPQIEFPENMDKLEKRKLERLYSQTVEVQYHPYSWVPSFSAFLNGRWYRSHPPVTDFDTLLKYRRSLAYFKLFLNSNSALARPFQEEDLIFYLKIDKVKTLKNSQKLLKKTVKEIVKKYLKGSNTTPLSFPLSPEEKKAIVNDAKKPHPNIFDALCVKLFTIINNNHVAKFLKSGFYKAYLDPSKRIAELLKTKSSSAQTPRSSLPSGSQTPTSHSLKKKSMIRGSRASSIFSSGPLTSRRGGSDSPKHKTKHSKEITILNSSIWDDPLERHPCIVVQSLLKQLIGITVDHFDLSPNSLTGIPVPNAEHLGSSNVAQSETGDSRREMSFSQLMMTSPDSMKGGSPTFSGIKGSARYNSFITHVGEIARCNLTPLTVEDVTGFFLNLYNLMFLHILIETGATVSSRNRKANTGIYTSYAYKIADMQFTPDDIEHGILRSNRGKSSLKSTHFPKNDKRKEFSCTQIDFRIHFCLTNYTKSSPPLFLFDHKMENPFKQSTQLSGTGLSLHLASQSEEDFSPLQYHFEIAAVWILSRISWFDVSNRSIYLPRQIGWYKPDFGESNKMVLNNLLPYLSHETREQLSPYIRSTSLKLNFYEFNWEPQVQVIYKGHGYGIVNKMEWPYCGEKPKSTKSKFGRRTLRRKGSAISRSRADTSLGLSSGTDRFSLSLRPGGMGIGSSPSGSMTDRAAAAHSSPGMPSRSGRESLEMFRARSSSMSFDEPNAVGPGSLTARLQRQQMSSSGNSGGGLFDFDTRSFGSRTSRNSGDSIQTFDVRGGRTFGSPSFRSDRSGSDVDTSSSTSHNLVPADSNKAIRRLSTSGSRPSFPSSPDTDADSTTTDSPDSSVGSPSPSPTEKFSHPRQIVHTPPQREPVPPPVTPDIPKHNFNTLSDILKEPSGLLCTAFREFLQEARPSLLSDWDCLSSIHTFRTLGTGDTFETIFSTYFKKKIVSVEPVIFKSFEQIMAGQSSADKTIFLPVEHSLSKYLEAMFLSPFLHSYQFKKSLPGALSWAPVKSKSQPIIEELQQTPSPASTPRSARGGKKYVFKIHFDSYDIIKLRLEKNSDVVQSVNRFLRHVKNSVSSRLEVELGAKATISYTDEDGDSCALLTDEDLQEVLRSGTTINLVLKNPISAPSPQKSVPVSVTPPESQPSTSTSSSHTNGSLSVPNTKFSHSKKASTASAISSKSPAHATPARSLSFGHELKLNSTRKILNDFPESESSTKSLATDQQNIVSELLGAMIRICEKHSVTPETKVHKKAVTRITRAKIKNLSASVIDFESVVEDTEYQTLEKHTQQLKSIDLEEIANRGKRALLTFFLNLFNLLSLHTRIWRRKNHCPTNPKLLNVEVNAIMNFTFYNVAGTNWNIIDILSILRGNFPVPADLLPSSSSKQPWSKFPQSKMIHYDLDDPLFCPPPFTSTDSRKTFCISDVNPLFLCCISFGTGSTGPLFVYFEGNVNKSIQSVARDYLASAIEIKRSEITLPQPLRWFQPDILSAHNSIPNFLLSLANTFPPNHKVASDLQKVASKKNLKISYKSMDWTPILFMRSNTSTS